MEKSHQPKDSPDIHKILLKSHKIGKGSSQGNLLHKKLVGSASTIYPNVPLLQSSKIGTPKSKVPLERVEDVESIYTQNGNSSLKPDTGVNQEVEDWTKALLPQEFSQFSKMIPPGSEASRRSHSTHRISPSSRGSDRYENKQKELILNFKKSQHIFGRQDVILLQSWLAQQLRNLEKKGVSKEEKLNLSNTAYNIVMKEIIKQVDVECKERGQLLKKVWTQAMSLNSYENTKFTRAQELLLEFEQKKNRELKERITKMQKEVDSLSKKLADQENTDSVRHGATGHSFMSSKKRIRFKDSHAKKRSHKHYEPKDYQMNGITSQFVKLLNEQDSDSDTDMIEKELERLDSHKEEHPITPEEVVEEEEEEDLDYINLAKKLENCQINSKAVSTQELEFRKDPFWEYEKKMNRGEVIEA